jgi:hypothetical protein
MRYHPGKCRSTHRVNPHAKKKGCVSISSGVANVVFEHLVGENIHRYPMSLTSLEYQVSELVSSDTCPRPTTRKKNTLGGHLAELVQAIEAPHVGAARADLCAEAVAEADLVVGRGRVSLLTNSDAWHSKPTCRFGSSSGRSRRFIHIPASGASAVAVSTYSTEAVNELPRLQNVFVSRIASRSPSHCCTPPYGRRTATCTQTLKP